MTPQPDTHKSSQLHGTQTDVSAVTRSMHDHPVDSEQHSSSVVKDLGDKPEHTTASGKTLDLFAGIDMGRDSSHDEDEHDNDADGGAFTKADKELGMDKFVPRQMIDKLKDNELISPDLPADMLLPVSDQWLYPQTAAAVYNDYRGQDAPTYESLAIGALNDKGEAKGSIGKTAKVLLYFNDRKVGFGAPAGENSGVVKQTFIMNSQVPGFYLTVERGNGRPNVQIRFHVNSMTRNEGPYGTGVGFAMYTSADRKLTADLARTGLTTGINASDGLWETRVKLLMNLRRPAFGPPASRPEFVGITIGGKDFNAIATAAVNLKPGDTSTGLTHGDWVLVLLSEASDISMFRFLHTNAESLKAFNCLKSFMCAAINDVALYGNFPHYRRQALHMGQTVTSRGLRLRDTVPPRHMVYEWRLTYDEEETLDNRGRPISAKAEQWRCFEKLKSYPDSESKALALRIGTERTRDFSVAVIQDLLDTKMGQLQASIMPIPQSDDLYWVEIAVEGGEGGLFGADQRLKPVINSRLEITITDAGDKHGLKLQGSVQDDLFNRTAELACLARITGKRQIEQGNYLVSVEMQDDGTPVDRQNATLIELGMGVEREDGVDLGCLVLRAAPKIGNTGSLAAELTNDPLAEAAIGDALAHWELNQKQEQAAILSTTTQSGTVIIHGPPGTGKSRALAAIGTVHCKVGRVSGINKRQVIFTAPSNYAVDQLLQTVDSHCDLKRERIRVCRFMGGKSPKAPRSSPLAQHAAEEAAKLDDFVGDGAQDALWELCAGFAETHKATALNQKYSLAVQRKEFIHEISKDKTHKWHGEAVYYRTTAKGLSTARKAKDQRAVEDARKELDINEGIWTQRFLEEVDFVFVTNSSAAHETLMDFFRPAVCIADEAALASVADIATPFAAFKESIKLVVMAGAHKQIGPRDLSKGANEFSKEFATSLFTQLVSNKGAEGLVMLTEQYRMKMAFSEMVSEVFYNGDLTSHISLSSTSALERTLHEFWGHIKPYWNGRLRIGVDVSGPGVAHDTTGCTKSYKNVVEASDLTALVEALLKFKPKSAAGRQVTRADFLIITPYAGQVTEIRRQLRVRKLTSVSESDEVECKVVTSAAVQGSENKIVLLSTVRNDPAKPMKVGSNKDARQLCVNYSRVQDCMVTFGNIGIWAEFQIRKAKAMVQMKKGQMAAFAKVIHSYRGKKDIISNAHFRAVIGRTEPLPQDDINARFENAAKAYIEKQAFEAESDRRKQAGETSAPPSKLQGVRSAEAGQARKARPNMVATYPYQEEQSSSAPPGTKRRRAAEPAMNRDRLVSPRT
ncbi:unnamed protein product [Zymoseptoria tritici ST99CH_3D1]|nr:unnamed protein product [Zymoseptoria tritici ST99CH_3D1]